MLKSIPPKKSIPSKKWRFIGGDLHKQNSKSEDPEKDLNEFKEKIRRRGSTKR